MPRATLLVPVGAEAAAVRRGADRRARVLEIRAGAATASDLPALDPAERIIALGLCGSLRERRVGEIVVYRRVVDDHVALACNPELLGDVLADAPRVDACTTDHVVTACAEREALAARFDADVVDMEGTHLAAALVALQAPFAMVRVVSDDCSRDLPALGDAIGADGSVRPLHVAWAFVRAPRTATAFVRDVQRALDTLADVAAVLTRASD